MRIILFILSLSFVNSISAHEFYFAFAEVEYDEMNSRIEATLTVSTHDFEFYLQQKGIIQGDLNKNKSDSLKIQLIEEEIIKHFNLTEGINIDYSNKNQKPYLGQLRLDGFETNLTGTVEFYLSIDVYQPLKSIEITFDLLMDQYPNQQNKLHLLTRNEKRTIDFLSSKKTQLIELN
jgi:hypothetical protein